MEKRERAVLYCKKLKKCRPNHILEKMDHIEKGIGFVLFYLYENKQNEIIAGDLAVGLNVSTARIAFLLNKMEEKGYINKTPSLKDGRKTIVELTEEGRKEVNRIINEGIYKMEYLMDKIGEKDLDELIRILMKIKSVMEETRDND